MLPLTRIPAGLPCVPRKTGQAAQLNLALTRSGFEQCSLVIPVYLRYSAVSKGILSLRFNNWCTYFYRDTNTKPCLRLLSQMQRSAILGVIHRNELRATIDPRVFNSRFSASEHRNALTMSPQGCTRDRASRPRHREVPSGDRKGKAAKRRVNALIGLLSFGYFSFQQKKSTSLQLRSSE